MTSGEVGIIITQKLRDRLLPTILMILDEQKNPYDMNPIVDLSTKPLDDLGLTRQILHALRPGAYGIDADQAGIHEM